ncbi:prepilin peptidase [Vibrio vulnificus]|nr:prepilin peptidase [Vibrio vulnificus]
MTLEFLKELQNLIFETFYNYPQWVNIALVAIIGACIGSFINVVTYRSPLIQKSKEELYVVENYGVEQSKHSFNNNLRSHCPTCLKKIPAKFNVPILGWLMLKGKSRCCGEMIHPKYILIELFTAVFAVGVFIIHGQIDLQLVLVLVAIFAAITISVIDFSHKLIFDKHALIYSSSSLLYLYVYTGQSEFIFTGALLTLILYLGVVGYQGIRNAVMKSDVQMMGDGDWILWYVMFCIISSLEPDINGLINRIAESVLLVALLGFLTLIFGLILDKTLKGKVTLSQEFPAAPSILCTSIGLISTTL